MNMTMAAAAPEDRTRTSSAAWGTLTQAARTLGRSTDIVKSATIAGAIKTRVIPGARITYNLDDCRKLAETP